MSSELPGDRAARLYIDQIIQINERFGMDGAIPEELYNKAVAAAEDAVKGLGQPTVLVK